MGMVMRSTRGGLGSGREVSRVGRITVSLPDGLEAKLDEVARQRGEPVSRVVAMAVEAFLEGPVQPPEAGPLQPIMHYVAGLSSHVAQLRNSLVELGNWSPARPPYGWQFPPPPPYPPPTWGAPGEQAQADTTAEPPV